MARSIPLLALAALVACSQPQATMPVPARSLCFAAEGLVWPLGNRTGGTGQTVLILERVPLDAHGMGGRAWAVDNIPNVTTGRWDRVSRDTLHLFLYDSFSSTDMRVGETDTALVGQAWGQTDERDASGKATTLRWEAALTATRCPQRIPT